MRQLLSFQPIFLPHKSNLLYVLHQTNLKSKNENVKAHLHLFGSTSLLSVCRRYGQETQYASPWNKTATKDSTPCSSWNQQLTEEVEWKNPTIHWTPGTKIRERVERCTNRVSHHRHHKLPLFRAEDKRPEYNSPPCECLEGEGVWLSLFSFRSESSSSWRCFSLSGAKKRDKLVARQPSSKRGRRLLGLPSSWVTSHSKPCKGEGRQSHADQAYKGGGWWRGQAHAIHHKTQIQMNQIKTKHWEEYTRLIITPKVGRSLRSGADSSN